jgi:hypothetical protein
MLKSGGFNQSGEGFPLSDAAEMRCALQNGKAVGPMCLPGLRSPGMLPRFDGDARSCADRCDSYAPAAI